MSENRIALVTGAAGGIGQSVCRALAEQGLQVVLADLDAAPLQALAEALPGQGHRTAAVDISSMASVEQLFGRLRSEGVKVSVLVNTAAISPVGEDGALIDVRSTTPELWEKVFAVNAFGTYAVCRAFVMQADAGMAHGRIINFASSAAQLGGYRSCTAYVASKAAVIAFTKALAREMAPLNITANVVAPGLVDTPMLRSRLDRKDDAGAVGLVPLSRVGQPDEVAAAVTYLVGPLAAYVTGSTLDVNGGYYMV
ncbi:SDR family NAD(P)-dependent oxidoreductase [Kerstersia gyiorum]|uniref:SDR family NAD(P)-dependent oxidoreductase n=1 Tax=Kerstersia gyiorum TaxID=206506 RepID=UPI00209D8589|nr:SDR family NAD(P)-dependent oxidoreductase [Kerstersia gyiorum]MCP1633920.1 3-oxoacyl-[acyl-carrier protein] reductase [Kerstersia gyiorum]MCP1637420.1 3-oxoacyl-[acyl-carrier protein] reductase [Kerstersia gyiorum]MCP1671787.1 3-oxoacyl-[acyl-carrier protein] reductase [Kerstersia gyiorum]MCP1679883.1 3-oxoacyl-[acyl-carrier protein] reductase [Kerstersia gyiorum]MCP1683314.1 3-oxoacyl-[acyl-carrier protein] reductase [Kerstersia gyiorum]